CAGCSPVTPASKASTSSCESMLWYAMCLLHNEGGEENIADLRAARSGRVSCAQHSAKFGGQGSPAIPGLDVVGILLREQPQCAVAHRGRVALDQLGRHLVIEPQRDCNVKHPA